MRVNRTALARFLYSLVLCTLAFVSCGKSGDAGSPPNLLSGNWQMALQADSASSAVPTESGFLIQSGKTLTGELLLSNQSECGGVGTVQGMLNGTDVEINLVQLGQTVTLTGTAPSDGTSMGGIFSILGSSCGGGSSTGSWSATPVKPVSGNYQATMNSYSHGVYNFAVTVTQGANTGGTTATLTGTMTSTNAFCANNITIAGVVSGTSIAFNLLTSDGTAIGQFTGTTTTDATTLTGTYDFLAEPGGCTGDSGTVSIVQQPAS